MQYLINEGYGTERTVEADSYNYHADNKLVVFWKHIPGEETSVAVFAMRLDDVMQIEAKPTV
jgi:hypothetical protein